MTEVSISRGRLFVVFSGTADAVERAMGCRIHVFALNGKSHFANLDSPQLPSDLGDDVAQVVGLDDFTALPQRVRAPQTQYVTASGMTALGPDDLATIYNTIGLYNQGIDGSGITVAVLGQTPLALSDYRAYRQLFGLAANDFQTAEFPGSGTGTGSADDQMEATLDLETIGALARGANILYVWGSTVEVAAVYVIDNQLAQIMSQSYAACETGSESFYQMIALQANAEGITWLSAAGDSGAAGCDAMEAPTASFGLNVMVPASAPNVTAVGGTAFAIGSFGGYWSPSNNGSKGSALGYVPETGWSSTTEVLGGGGGVSALFSKPGFQSDVGPSIGNGRLVPDVALASAPAPVPYQIIFNGSPTFVGGTSAATPVFAGISALVNQYLLAQGSAHAPGLGNMNPALYLLAEQAPWVFHDVTTGSNDAPCTIGTPDCTAGTLGYAAGPGYDLATGLGSVDAYALASNWASAVLESSSTLLSASANQTEAEQSISLAATVTSGEVPLAATPVEFYYSNPQYQASQTLLGGAVTDATGNATLKTNLLPSGTNTVIAAATGTTKVSPSPDSNAVTVTVAAFPTSVGVTPSSGPYQAGQTVTLTVSVTGPVGDGLAGPAASNSSTNSFFTAGTVSLYDTAGNLETLAALSNSGAADLALTLAAGANRFYVAYSGSAYASASQSAIVILYAATEPADFTLSGSSAVSLTAGSSTSAPLTITPLNGFNQTIQLSCTGLPAGYTCTLPATLTPAATTSVTVTFASTSATLAGAIPLAFLILLLPGTKKRVNFFAALHLKHLAALVIIVLAATLTDGCASAGQNSGSSTHGSQIYLATVTASSGSISHQLAIEVTVTQ
jgi:subtilase family serine protease